MCNKWKIALGAAPKCGSSCLDSLVQINQVREKIPGESRMRMPRVDFDVIPGGYEIIGIVRHPIARFYSLYTWVNDVFRPNFFKSVWGLPVREFWEWVETDIERNLHFEPQYRFDLDKSDVVVRLDNLNAWWSDNKPEGATDTTLENKSVGHVDQDEWVNDRILTAYQTDLDCMSL